MLPLSVIGAGQRSVPNLTQLWLTWTGIPDIERATFFVARSDKAGPMTGVRFAATKRTQETQHAFHDALGSQADEREVRRDLFLQYKDQRQHSFWKWCVRRDREEMQGPVEWWWWLSCLRHGNAKRASSYLATHLGLSPRLTKRCIVAFQNPTLGPDGLLTGDEYDPPSHLLISWMGSSVSIPLTGEIREKVLGIVLRSSMEKGDKV